ncbi:winged helix-turn-helix domain-containing protein [Tabrizicola sp.]|uniref:winged helix-turn-helix domain-containing protein n=1 Tax=Tabrizicola sp. TaxID=2005166 RepID=UPI003F3F9D13
MDPQVISIGELTLDLAQGRLFSRHGDVPIRPKALKLLTAMVQQSGRVMTKDDLMSEVWPDVIVSEDSLTQCVHEVRKALGPDGPSLLRTVPRRGYMLADVGLSVMTMPSVLATAEAGSIAVMPFLMPDGTPSRMRILFDGLTHDVISRLARLRAYRVTGRGSVFALRNFGEDPWRLRQLLRVSNVVSGRVVSGSGAAGEPFRLVVDLVRTDDGSLEWSDEIVVSADDLHRSSAHIADRLVSVISLAVTEAEIRAALSDRNGGSEAWRELHLGLHHAFQFTPDGMHAALGHLETSTALDPGSSRAHAFVSFCQYHLAFTNRLGDRKAGAAVALASADRALAADALCPVAHWAYGRAQWLGGNLDAAKEHVARGIDLSPSFPNAHYMLGFLECHAGDPVRALESLERSESLSPFDPFLPSIQLSRANAYFRLGDLDEAAHWAARSAAHRSTYGHMLFNAALILQEAGRTEEAKSMMGQLRKRDPDYDPEQYFATFYSLTAEVSRVFRKGLRQLGV